MDGEPVEGIDSETELIEPVNSEEEVLVDLLMANEDIMIKALVDSSSDAEFVVYIVEKDTMVEASENSGVELMEKPGVKLLDDELNVETELVELVVVGEIVGKVFEVELELTVVELVAVLELTVLELTVLELTVLELTVLELTVLELTVLELTVLELVDSNNYNYIYIII